ncbi:beta-mannosidase [Sphingomonas parva]|uniref:Mannan endo-1,4-beta-mannosidase n=1 Tax=Sphingomonas parva TaxID=2555898 RepID=A0A4Y8ZY66_9SPHN|nr:glycosyl hydrolase [Sphingomonas parva]TFI59859.1 beta-mannosidase [Sphingomonas parva]
MIARAKAGALAAAMLALTACATAPGPRGGAAAVQLADRKATPETRALFANLQRISRDCVLFGHHDDLAYGMGWTGEAGRSDVKDVAGAYPAVYGWDVGRLFRNGQPDLADPQRAEELRRWILEGFGRGGVISLAWHMPNPVNDTDSWNTARAVDAIIPGGRLHGDYKAKLDVVAAFLNGLRTEDGRRVPVIFRPFHEHTGSWFWWGRDHASVDAFKQLWRFTVAYLRDEKGVRNALYAYSTDVFDSEAEYLERYPGDDVIDLLGFDDYHSVKTAETRAVFVNRLRLLAKMARERGKLAALTETGVETIPDPEWWTAVLLPALKDPSIGGGIAYALVWRNANPANDRKDHFYAPYPGHPSAADFARFKQDPAILFEDELPDLYR